jgi:hypothetical protein
MATTDFGKISLKPSTKMSLNDRFQLLRQTQRRTQTNAINNNKTALQLRQGSQKNKRLALQMANRPSVIAALRANGNQSIKQRLGNQRLNNQLNNNIVGNNQNFGQRNINARNRNPKRFINRSNFNTNVGFNRNQMRQQFQNRRNNSQNIGVVVGVRKNVRKGIKTNRFRKAQSFKITSPTKANFKPKRKGMGGQFKNQNQSNKTGAKKLKINRNFNARNNGGQQPLRRKQNVKLDKQQLDKDLDAYMAGTKSYLDAELDAYMSQTN